MANYYTQFSFAYHFSDEEKATKAKELFNSAYGVYANLVNTEEYSTHTVVVTSWEGSVEEVLDIYAILCIEHDVTGVLCFTWSHICSSMRTDGFGGGIATSAFDGDQMITVVNDFLGNAPRATGVNPLLSHTGFSGYNTEHAQMDPSNDTNCQSE